MRHLTSTDLEELEARLHTERDAVLDAIRARLAGRGQAHHHELINELIDSLASGDSRTAAQLLTASDAVLLGPELAELEAIDVALKRIDFGAGGLCVQCGGPIPLARLRSAPAVLTCPDCLQRARVAPARHGQASA